MCIIFYGTNTLYFYAKCMCGISLVYVFRFVCWILWMITSRTDLFHFSSNQATPLRKIMDVIQVTITISPREDISATTASITLGTIITMASINTNTITMEKTNMAMTTIAIITTIMASSKTSLYLDPKKFKKKIVCKLPKKSVTHNSTAFYFLGIGNHDISRVAYRPRKSTYPMISVDEALKIVLEHAQPLGAEEIGLRGCFKIRF